MFGLRRVVKKKLCPLTARPPRRHEASYLRGICQFLLNKKRWIEVAGDRRGHLRGLGHRRVDRFGHRPGRAPVRAHPPGADTMTLTEAGGKGTTEEADTVITTGDQTMVPEEITTGGAATGNIGTGLLCDGFFEGAACGGGL